MPSPTVNVDPNPVPGRLLEPLCQALVEVLAEGTWSCIQADHAKVKLAWREDLEPGCGKPRYVERVLADLNPQEIIAVANRCIDRFSGSRTRTLQDAVWLLESGGEIAVTELTRQRLAYALDADGRQLHPRQEPHEFLCQFATTANDWLKPQVAYVQGHLTCSAVSSPFGLDELLATPQSRQRMSHLDLLDLYGFRNWPDRRLFLFLEAMVHPTARSGLSQAEWVDFINVVLGPDGFALCEVSRVSHEPVFEVQKRAGGMASRPKNLIFASTGPKPEIGFHDAVSNDIVILKGADTCLVYDEPILQSGLRWTDLVKWWSQHNDCPDEKEARKSVGARLLSAVGSPPEANLFGSYFREFTHVLEDRLPALIPQVYLHFDPMTLRQLRSRGEGKRFPVQRMDFLLLLPNGVRVVLEVDGQQHYSTEGKPSPAVYSETVASDRHLRLLGYEVYRFGGYELFQKARANRTVQEFFCRLFEKHGIT